jgi:hypothetical protein
MSDKITYWSLITALLVVHDRPEGFTSSEIDAALAGRLGQGSWRRLSDLKKDKLIDVVVKDGEQVKRVGEGGVRQRAYRITDAGRSWFDVMSDDWS